MWNKEKEPHPFLHNQMLDLKTGTWRHKEMQTFILVFPCSGWYLPRLPGPESPSGRKPPAASTAEHWISQEQPALLQQPGGVPGGIPRGPRPHERLQGPSKRIQRWAAPPNTHWLCLHQLRTARVKLSGCCDTGVASLWDAETCSKNLTGCRSAT